MGVKGVNPHTYLSTRGYYKKKNILYLFLLTLFFYRLEMKVCVLTWKRNNCPFCNKRFMRFKSLLDHMILRHASTHEGTRGRKMKELGQKYIKIRDELILKDMKRRFVN